MSLKYLVLGDFWPYFPIFDQISAFFRRFFKKNYQKIHLPHRSGIFSTFFAVWGPKVTGSSFGPILVAGSGPHNFFENRVKTPQNWDHLLGVHFPTPFLEP